MEKDIQHGLLDNLTKEDIDLIKAEVEQLYLESKECTNTEKERVKKQCWVIERKSVLRSTQFTKMKCNRGPYIY